MSRIKLESERKDVAVDIREYEDCVYLIVSTEGGSCGVLLSEQSATEECIEMLQCAYFPLLRSERDKDRAALRLIIKAICILRDEPLQQPEESEPQ